MRIDEIILDIEELKRDLIAYMFTNGYMEGRGLHEKAHELQKDIEMILAKHAVLSEIED